MGAAASVDGGEELLCSLENTKKTESSKIDGATPEWLSTMRSQDIETQSQKYQNSAQDYSPFVNCWSCFRVIERKKAAFRRRATSSTTTERFFCSRKCRTQSCHEVAIADRIEEALATNTVEYEKWKDKYDMTDYSEKDLCAPPGIASFPSSSSSTKENSK